MRHVRFFLFALAVLATCAIGSAQVAIPYTFTAGTIIRSDEVNTNFATLAAAALNRTGGTITGNVNVSSGVTIDGVDISEVLAEAAVSGVPAGAVMPFNLASCPTGWAEFTTARGRYVVGLPSGGTLNGTAGTALTNAENRATGVHSHTVTDPGHHHTVGQIGDGAVSGPTGDLHVTGLRDTGDEVTGLTVDNSTGVAGTNAPYIQLLMCQKNP